MEIERITVKTPNKGDVVWAIRLPCHCGIYEGDDSVIHFAPPNDSNVKEEAVIHKSTLSEFATGSPVIVIEFPPEKCFSPEETINRAYSRLDEHTYNLFLNNCDHFATWCKTGEHHSLQFDLLRQIAIIICELIDKSNGNQTEYKKAAEIICKIFEIIEIFLSLEFKKTIT